MPLDGSTTVTLSVMGKAFAPMNENYLPDAAAREFVVNFNSTADESGVGNPTTDVPFADILKAVSTGKNVRAVWKITIMAGSGVFFRYCLLQLSSADTINDYVVFTHTECPEHGKLDVLSIKYFKNGTTYAWEYSITTTT